MKKKNGEFCRQNIDAEVEMTTTTFLCRRWQAVAARVVFRQNLKTLNVEKFVDTNCDVRPTFRRWMCRHLQTVATTFFTPNP